MPILKFTALYSAQVMRTMIRVESEAIGLLKVSCNAKYCDNIAKYCLKNGQGKKYFLCYLHYCYISAITEVELNKIVRKSSGGEPLDGKLSRVVRRRLSSERGMSLGETE